MKTALVTVTALAFLVLLVVVVVADALESIPTLAGVLS